MPHDIAINVERLSKVYRIGMKDERPETLAGTVAGWIKSPFRNYRRLRSLSDFRDLQADCSHPRPAAGTKAPTEEDILWALRDVSFQVKRGEVLGVIGRNGAGKSTLLKLLTGITEPTSGRAEIRGRVASLLEVGTGFHPDLTGRENIYLNGTILGMTRKEIDRKFDEIVDFSGIERFIETPVKRYSSGMYVRLAFAVAAHLDPEILLVDEVLAVGDMEFQKKCLGKMDAITKGGRTIIFVSHNMPAIENLCHRALLLNEGCVETLDEVHAVTGLYFRGMKASVRNQTVLGRSYDGSIQLVAFRVGADDNEFVHCGAPLNVSITLETARPVSGLEASLALNNSAGQRLAVLHSKVAGCDLAVSKGRHTLVCKVDSVPFLPGEYSMDLKLYENGISLMVVMSIGQLVVRDSDWLGTGRLPDPSWGGDFVLRHAWVADHADSPNRLIASQDRKV